MQQLDSSSAKSGVGPSWLADLDAYIGTHPAGIHEADHTERHGLVAAVKAAPQSAEAWRALLAFEEVHCSNLTQQQPGAADPSRVSLYHLYFYATQLVPRNKNQHKEAYLQLWLGFARQQWTRSQDDARDTFKTLKNQHIGDASASLYYEWAVLEHSAGNVSKALGILAKGMRAEAQPISLLQQLQGELQSGTFDLKAAGAVTETLTLDPGALTAQHPVTTPAPSTGLGLRAGLPYSSLASAARAPASSLAGSAHPRGSSIASCLKAPAAGVAGQQEHHVVRAVTFAADVHDTGVELGAASHPHRAGSVSACSQRSMSQTAEGHSGCLSTVSSSPSRSMVSAHDGTMPFSSGAVSYKSSTTESSTVGGLEEATISCGVTAAAAEGKGSAHGKPSTAPLAGSSSLTPAAGGNATATLGLKRFGFKSRALRVGGAVQASADAQAPDAHAEVAPLAARQPSEAAADTSAAGDADDGQDAAAGRKRRAAAESVPSPSVSPKLAAAVRHGQQCRVQPGEEVRHSREGVSSCAQGLQVQGVPGSRPGARDRAPVVSQQPAEAVTSTDDDSVPLVGSKLAACAQDRGTPLAAGRGRDAVAQGLGLWSSPVEGQLPSSLETTPTDVLVAAGEAGGSSTWGRHASKCPQAAALDRDKQRERSSTQEQQQHHRSDAPQPGRVRQPLAVVPSVTPAAQDAPDEDMQPLPTVVLSDVPAVACNGAGRQQGAAAAHGSTSQRATHSSSGNVQQQQQQQHAPQQHASAREPLRPLQHPQQVPAPREPGSVASKSQQAAPADKPVQTQAAAHAPVIQQQVQRPREAVVQHPQNRGPQQQQQQQHAAQQPQQPQQQQQQHARPGTQHQQQGQQQQQQVQQQAQPQGRQQQQQGSAVRQLRPKEDPQTVFVQGVRYHKLECVGRGGSSKVFKVMGPGCKIYALKRIKLAGRDEEAASGFIDEINLLNSLKDKPNIIQLVDSQVFTEEGLIYMVQEYGEIDLARLLAKHDASRKEAGALKDNIDENFIRLYWQQMLQAVAGVHEQRIVHSDLKPANFLLVEGQLKLIDFGIAKAISGDTTSIARESQVGTLNYMSPEAILGGSNNILGGPAMKVGRPSDVWSLGCILYQMVHGRTPFADLPFVPKMHAICNPQHRVNYPELANKDLMDVMRRCLDRDPKSRITLQELLDHPFLHPNRSTTSAPAAPAVLSEEQMKLLVAQVQAAGAAGVTDLDRLTRDLMQKLGSTSLHGSSVASDSSTNSSPRGTAGLHAGSRPSTGGPKQQPRQQAAAGQQRQGTVSEAASVSSSSKSRIPAAPPAAPGWR